MKAVEYERIVSSIEAGMHQGDCMQTLAKEFPR